MRDGIEEELQVREVAIEPFSISHSLKQLTYPPKDGVLNYHDLR